MALSDLTSTDYTPAEFTAAHLAFHHSLAGLTGFERLVAVADSLHAELQLALAHVDRPSRNAADRVPSHADLLALLESGAIDAATNELARHLGDGQISMLAAIGDRDDQDASA